MKNENIIIVGGGIGGLTTALALARRRIPSYVLERSPSFREAGAGIMLCPNVFKVYEHLGIDEKILESCFFPEYMIYTDGLTGKEFVNLPMGDEIVKRFNHPYASVHRGEFLKVLLEECLKSSYITCITSAFVVEVKENGQNVEAITEDKKVYKGAALVGCDGLWSEARKFILGNEKLNSFPRVTYRGLVPEEKLSLKLRSNNLIHFDRPGGHVVLYRIGKDKLFNVVMVHDLDGVVDDQQIQGNEQELRSKFAGSVPEVMELLNLVDTTKRWFMYDREPAKIWSKGKMTLLGDAAHPTLPHLTQGAAMAIEDAAIVAKMIDQNRNNIEKAFKLYQEARYLRTAHVQLFSRAYAEVHHAGDVMRELKLNLLSKRTNEENYHWLKQIYEGIDL